MASELVPGNFFLVENNASFSWFSLESQTRFGTSGELLIHKKKKKTLIRAKNSSADFTN